MKDLAEVLNVKTDLDRRDGMSSQTEPQQNTTLAPDTREYLEWKRRFSSLVIQIDRLRSELTGRAILDIAPIDGKWSLKQTLGHLIDVDKDIWGPRIEHLLESVVEPVWESIDQDALVQAHKWEEKSTDELCAELIRVRWNLAALINRLTPEELTRTGRHYSKGSLSIPQIVRLVAEHDDHHLFRVRQALDSM